jgi:hypothetical protein
MMTTAKETMTRSNDRFALDTREPMVGRFGMQDKMMFNAPHAKVVKTF